MLNQAIIDAIEETDFADTALETALLNKISPARATKFLQTAGHIVKPKTEYETEVKTEATKIAKVDTDAAIRAEGARFFGDIDALLKDIAKTDKPTGMKTTEWYQLIKDKIKLPEEGDPVKQGQIEALQKKVEELSKKQETPAVDIAKETNKLVKASLKGIEVPIPATADTDAKKAEARKAGLSMIDTLLKAQYEYGGETADGEQYFILKGDTEKKAIVHADGDPYTAAEIAAEKFPQLIAVKGHKQQGGGTKADAEQAAGNTLKDLYIEAGKLHSPGSPAWRKYVNEKAKEREIKI